MVGLPVVGVRGVVGFLSRLSRPGPDGKVRRYVFPIQSGEAGLRFVIASEAFLLCPQRRSK